MNTTVVLFARRSVAYLIDGFLMLFLANLIVGVRIAWFGQVSPHADAWLHGVTVVLAAIYYVGAHCKFGRTIGKAIMRLRVIGYAGQVSLTEATVRYVPFFVEAVGFAAADIFGWSLAHIQIRGEQIAVWSVVFSVWVVAEIVVALLKRGTRSIHDFLAHTSVIDAKHANQALSSPNACGVAHLNR